VNNANYEAPLTQPKLRKICGNLVSEYESSERDRYISCMVKKLVHVAVIIFSNFRLVFSEIKRILGMIKIAF